MIDVAVIASTPHLAGLSTAGSIDMALTHLVLTEPAQAAHFAARAQSKVRVVLDNSAYELEDTTGQGMSAEAVLRAAHLINPAVVICHDVLYDGPATVEATRRFLAEAADLTEPGRFTYMAVPQGSTRREWLDCHARLADLPGVGMIGLSKLSVPRCFAGPVAEARLDCLAALTDGGTPPPLPMHLLGGDRSLIWELRQHRERGYDTFITSNDSSFAFWYAAHDLPADGRTGRAERQAPDKPNLHDHVLDPVRLAAAHRHVALLRDAAGLPSLPAETPSEQEAAWH
ncbi:hypothetical protein Vqi01_49600 [Micromonospora qiuiae]|uniref:Uncharacterized protein n=1 Tax=Micromonospora qiuiae TaxID=502268 RepID=A0ABQ4JGQ7_9ACTN|nr:hypothetical protein [Micromonospora qiuiae]GIJ29798.1 hypothetical protein Vqi01_49600 [Micromonospora qiuiae]